MFFPLYINLENEKVLVIGGGKLANRKSKILSEYGADVTIYSKEIVDEELKDRIDVKFIYENIEKDEEKILNLVKDYFVVIAATNDLELNEIVAKVCMKEKILVNNVSSKLTMNVMFGAVVKNDEFHVSISTNGVSCKRSRAMKSLIQKTIDSVVKKEK